jgi:hypothetical protein
MRGGIGGQGARGGKGAIDTAAAADPGGSSEYFRGRRALNGYLWGANSPFATLAVGNLGVGGEDKIRTIPHWFGRAGTIGRMGWWPNTQSGGGAEFRWAIYSDNNGAPDTLLYDSGAQTSWWVGGHSGVVSWKHTTLNLDVEAMTLYHLAWKVNAAFRTANISVSYFPTDQAPNILGYMPGDVLGVHFATYPTASNLGNQRQNGWRVDHAFATAYPTTFPSSPNYVPYHALSFTGDGAMETKHLTFTYEFTPA